MLSPLPRRCFAALLLFGFVFATGCQKQTPSPYDLSETTRKVVDALPSDTFFLAYADVATMLEHPFFVEMIDLEEHLAQARIDSGRTVQQLFDSLGFDPFHDVSSGYLAVFDDNQESAEALIFLKGDFDSDAMVTHLKAATPLPLREIVYKQHTLMLADSLKDPVAMCFPEDGELFLASRVEVLQGVLDRWDGSSPPASREVQELLAEVQHPEGPWVVIANVFPQLAKADSLGPFKQFSDALPFLKDGIGSMKLEEEAITFAATATTTTDYADRSGDVADLIRGGISAMKIQITDRTEVEAEEILKMLDRVKVNDAKGKVTANFYLEKADLDRFVDMIHEEMKRKKRSIDDNVE